MVRVFTEEPDGCRVAWLTREKTENMLHLRSWSFVILMVSCFPPLCKPESNPAGFPPSAAKYTQGFANEPCVTE